MDYQVFFLSHCMTRPEEILTGKAGIEPGSVTLEAVCHDKAKRLCHISPYHTRVTSCHSQQCYVFHAVPRCVKAGAVPFCTLSMFCYIHRIVGLAVKVSTSTAQILVRSPLAVGFFRVESYQ